MSNYSFKILNFRIKAVFNSNLANNHYIYLLSNGLYSPRHQPPPHPHLISLCSTNGEPTLMGSMGVGCGDTLMAAIRQLLTF